MLFCTGWLIYNPELIIKNIYFFILCPPNKFNSKRSKKKENNKDVSSRFIYRETLYNLFLKEDIIWLYRHHTPMIYRKRLKYEWQYNFAVRVSCRPVLGGRLPPQKNQLLPPKIFTDFIFIHPEPPTPRLLPPPQSPSTPPPPKVKSCRKPWQFLLF